MNATWVGIYDRGNITTERIHFRATVDIKLQYFVLLDTQKQSPTEVQTGNKGCFWFGPKVIKAGENVVVYSRAGTNNSENRPDGSVFHFFFRGLNQPLYIPNAKCAILIEINSWATSP